MTQHDKRRTVLVVDDDDDIREAVRELLEDEGCRVYTAANGAEALETLETIPDRPCLILLDLMMPVMTGWDVLRHLQTDDVLAAIPVAVVSASHDPEVTGVRFFRKPIALETLIQLVRVQDGSAL